MTTNKKISPTKKTKFLPVISIIFIVLSSFVIISLFIRKNQTNSTPIRLDQLFEEINQEISNLDKKRISVTKQEPFTYLNWTDGDIELGMIPSDYSLEISVIEDETTEIDKTIHQKIAKSIEDILIKNGFKVDKDNTWTNDSDYFSFLNFIHGYKSDQINCSVESNSTVFISTNFSSILTFSCFQNDKFQKTYKEQYPFILALQEAGEYEPIGNITVNGNSAIVYLNGSRVNVYLHKNKDGKWVFIMKNQDFSCKELEEKGVPKKDLIDCMNEDGSYYVL